MSLEEKRRIYEQEQVRFQACERITALASGEV